MENKDKNEAVIVLDDGMVIRGRNCGHSGTSIGELCFNTGMMGYQEIFSDPSYFGQVLIMNHVEVGNYGTSPVFLESNGAKVNGIIGRNFDDSLHPFFLNHEVVAIDQIDTRALVTHIREKTSVRCIMSTEVDDIFVLQKKLNEHPEIENQDLVANVTTPTPYFSGREDAAVKIALLDLGVKKSIIENLVARGAYVKIFNAQSDFNDMLDFKPDGFIVSNGPGNPANMKHAISVIQKIIARDYPLFGICLGHQLLALANGVRTFKMFNGHRGSNHPVKNIITGRSAITTQNHGYGIDPEGVKRNENIEITHVNLNDQSIEGIRIKGTKAFPCNFIPRLRRVPMIAFTFLMIF